MVHEIEACSGTCDNCGELFESYHDGFTIFVDDSSLLERMDASEWYAGGSDPEHQGKHYCPNCFENHPDDDDKIIVDLSRKQRMAIEAVKPISGIGLMAEMRKRLTEVEKWDLTHDGTGVGLAIGAELAIIFTLILVFILKCC
jgi:hypothetical protein